MKKLFVPLALALALGACGGEASTPAGGIAIEVGSHGYEPARVEATAGEPLTLVFTRTTDEGCGQELVIASQDIRRNLPLDEAVEVTFTPEETGELRFTCGMDMYDGTIVVQ